MFYKLMTSIKLKWGNQGFQLLLQKEGKGWLSVVILHLKLLIMILPIWALYHLFAFPEKIKGSFYHRKVFLSFKNAVFEPSSPQSPHCWNMYMYNLIDKKPILFLYCDGGPDHWLTYVLFQLSLITLFAVLHGFIPGKIQLKGSCQWII